MHTTSLLPKKAPVRPRVFVGSGAALLEGEIRALVDSGASGLVALVGPPGSGKTTALAHLLAALGPGASVAVLDNPDAAEELAPPKHSLLIFTGYHADNVSCVLATYRLAPWTRDDLIEYLLATHSDQCASVMSRLGPDDLAFIGGVPEIGRIVCD